MILIPRKRLRYSLLELCEEEELRGEENDEAHQNALLQDIILDCRFQTARGCGLVYQKWTRKEKKKGELETPCMYRVILLSSSSLCLR
jgi:hypothetical protein